MLIGTNLCENPL
jgi:hypothetical protein